VAERALTVERLHDMRLAMRRQAKNEMTDWLTFYNGTRLHSMLKWAGALDQADRLQGFPPAGHPLLLRQLGHPPSRRVLSGTAILQS
jgi:hypothetical protein